jgi:thiamine-phosphate pyrophosphorylase
LALETARAIPRLYVVSDRQQTQARPLAQVMTSAAQGGAGMVQLREKDLSARELFALGTELQGALATHGVPLLINDRLDVALALGAAGAHLAGHSLSTAHARRVLGPHKLIGVSTHSLAQARAAMDEGADFIVFGPVFETPSKMAYGLPQGLRQLADVVRHVTIPVLAIGGIDADNLTLVMREGAHGVAMIRAILAAPDPGAAARRLRLLLPE